MENGIYQNCYELIQQYIYGGVELTPAMELVTVLISTLGCIALVALPFVLVYFLIRFIIGGFR